MNRKSIPVDDLGTRFHHLWNSQWFLLTAGDFTTRDFNTMTVSWGSLGVMWNRPVAQVVVRPVRHTFGFLERHATFTLCAFPERYHEALVLLGSKSGYDGDKIAESGLTPQGASVVAAPVFAEAELVLECRKIYSDDFNPARFLDPSIASNYPNKDYHRIYFGEIVAIAGTDKYRRTDGGATLPDGTS
ncbi:MAG: flavin reductase [Opitutaceae bacterium]|nr:flavin reductase [Opitutaceae bacterium]